MRRRPAWVAARSARGDRPYIAPIAAEATGSDRHAETFPRTSTVHLEYAARGDMPPVKLSWYDGGLKPEKPPEIVDPYGAPVCDGVQVLIIAASPDPDWSFAALETPDQKGKSFLRRRGGDVGGKTVKFIGWDRVWMTSGSQLCQAQMFKPPAPPVASALLPTMVLLLMVMPAVSEMAPPELAELAEKVQLLIANEPKL